MRKQFHLVHLRTNFRRWIEKILAPICDGICNMWPKRLVIFEGYLTKIDRNLFWLPLISLDLQKVLWPKIKPGKKTYSQQLVHIKRCNTLPTIEAALPSFDGLPILPHTSAGNDFATLRINWIRPLCEATEGSIQLVKKNMMINPLYDFQCSPLWAKSLLAFTIPYSLDFRPSGTIKQHIANFQTTNRCRNGYPRPLTVFPIIRLNCQGVNDPLSKMSFSSQFVFSRVLTY